MREKRKTCIVTFMTTTGAMAMEQACRMAGVPGRLIPVPRSIFADCGMCWAAPWDKREEVETLVVKQHLDVAGIYDILL